MFRNYLKTAFRNIGRNKMLSFVNITGLAVGLASVILIMLFVMDEWNFDKLNNKGKNVYRLVRTVTDTSGMESRAGNTGVPHGPVFAAEVPEIESYCRLYGWDMPTKKGGEGIEAKVLFVDNSIFDMFSIDVVKGNPSAMLKSRNAVVLSDEAAAKYFGTENPMGKVVEIETEDKFEPFEVTGVVKKMPANSSIQFDMLISFETQMPTDPAEYSEKAGNWRTLYLNTFFLLKKNADPQKAEAKLFPVYVKHNGDSWEKSKTQYGITKMEYKLQPLYDIHLNSNFYASNGLSFWSDSMYSYILACLAILILVIACINFINIALARGIQRNKEIGIRKVSGSSRKQVILQFLGESLITSVIAFVVAVILAQLALPAFNSIAQRNFNFSYLLQPNTLIVCTILVLFVSLLAGFYPAFIASGFSPVQTLYGRFRFGGRNIIGKVLVVIQFIIAVSLITGTIIFNRQFNFISKTDLGYNVNNMFHLQFPWGRPEDLRRFRAELEKNPDIVSVGVKSGDMNSTKLEVNGKQTDWTYYEHIDDNFLQTLHIPLIKGRYLSYNNVADTVSNCLVNETFVKTYIGKTKDPIGQVVSWPGGDGAHTIVGVVKDYHSTDLKQMIKPIYLTLDNGDDLLNTYIKYQPGKEKEARKAITAAYKSVVPYSTMSLFNMDEWLMQRYEQDMQWKKIVSFAAFVSILISIMGLFALTSLAVQKRIKEIGIRKVLGASVSVITFIISKDFLKLVIISLLVAFPLAWWLMGKWLQDFAYRVDIAWWMFAIAGIIAILIASITVSIQAIRAAIANPVKSIRTE